MTITGTTTAFQVLSMLAGAVFVARYMMTRWWKTPGGRNVMAFMGLVVLLTTLGLLRNVFSPQTWEYVRLVAWISVFAVLVWRDQILFRAQRQGEQHENFRSGADGNHRRD